MKKKLLLAAFAMAMATPLQAQALFEEDFNDYDMDTWILGLLHGEDISVGPINSFPAMSSIGFSSVAMGATTFEVIENEAVHVDNTDLLIVTPPIALPAGGSLLNYRVGSLAVGQGSAHYSLYVLTAVDMAGITTVTQLGQMVDTKVAEESSNVSGQSEVISRSLSAYEGQTIRVAFRLHDTASNVLLLLDDVSIQSTLGVIEPELVTFSAYPNPAHDIVNIEGIGAQHFESLRLTDTNGRTVATKVLDGSDKAHIDITPFNTGVYILSITSDKGIATKRIIKQ